jgi:hypothetical protein
MRAAFTPIKARAREFTPGLPKKIYINAETSEHLFARGSKSIRILAS